MVTKMGKYYCVYCPEHPRATKEGYVYKHVLVAEEMLGRYLKDGEVVHHKDRNKLNNSPDNLMVFRSIADHSGYHKGCEIYKIGDVYAAKLHQKNICPVCGGFKDAKANTCNGCCRRIKSTHVEAFDDAFRSKLKDMIRNKPFVEIGRIFGVTDNSVRKWCKKLNLPFKSSEIKNISDQDWALI